MTAYAVLMNKRVKLGECIVFQTTQSLPMTEAPSPGRPLRGVRVFDLSRVLTGFFCTMILAKDHSSAMTAKGWAVVALPYWDSR